MTLRKIVTLPAPVLRRKARAITKFDKNLSTLIDDMVETMRDAPGPRRISQRAVRDLSSVGGGGFAGGLQATVLKAFNTNLVVKRASAAVSIVSCLLTFQGVGRVRH